MPNTAVAAAPIAKITFQPLKASVSSSPAPPLHSMIKANDSQWLGWMSLPARLSPFESWSEQEDWESVRNCTTQTAASIHWNSLCWEQQNRSQIWVCLTEFLLLAIERSILRKLQYIGTIIAKDIFPIRLCKAGIRRGQFQHSCKYLDTDIAVSIQKKNMN